ncbi:hypothetical protein ACFC1I_04675 [Microbacterium sp. NPDC056044]|uniref:hypothetical protein n=1 Tax=Microbacterium sp. NPDC056044 TaxID=3345690 RepID=UPI0035DAD8DB
MNEADMMFSHVGSARDGAAARVGAGVAVAVGAAAAGASSSGVLAMTPGAAVHAVVIRNGRRSAASAADRRCGKAWLLI